LLPDWTGGNVSIMRRRDILGSADLPLQRQQTVRHRLPELPRPHERVKLQGSAEPGDTFSGFLETNSPSRNAVEWERRRPDAVTGGLGRLLAAGTHATGAVPGDASMLRYAWLTALVCLSLVDDAWSQAPAKLNVVWFVGDDLNTNLGCYGHPVVKSPHIDRLAARGIRFERAYTNVPVCNPSRTSFLSGRRPRDPDQAKAVFLPNYFQKHGYRTIEVGHVRHAYGLSQERAAFDEHHDGSVPKALEFLGRKHDQPFLLAIGLSHTHPGFHSTPPFQKLYPYDQMMLPREPADIKGRVPADAFHKLEVRAVTADEHRKHLARYYASVSTLDSEVGAVLDALDKLDLGKNTVVLLSSDHGRLLGEHGGIFDKRCLFEQSVRIPFIVAAPGWQGKTSPRLVENIDIYPTLVELCGLPMPEGLQGLSLLPLLREPQRPWRQAAFSHSPVHATGTTMRTERYRYTEWGDPKVAELYDHQNDPLEHRNLVNEPAHAELARDLRRMFAAGWQGALPR